MTDVTVEIAVTEVADADALALPPTTGAADPVAKTAILTLIHRAAATATASEKIDTLAATVVDPIVVIGSGIVTGAPTVVRIVALTAGPSVEVAAGGTMTKAAVAGTETAT